MGGRLCGLHGQRASRRRTHERGLNPIPLLPRTRLWLGEIPKSEAGSFMSAQLVPNKGSGDYRAILLVAGINRPGSTASATSPTSAAGCCCSPLSPASPTISRRGHSRTRCLNMDAHGVGCGSSSGGAWCWRSPRWSSRPGSSGVSGFTHRTPRPALLSRPPRPAGQAGPGFGS